MSEKKKIVIIGAGFGGLQAVKKLAGDKNLSITLIDKANHHLFQPLLYQVATAVLSPADIAIPIRSLTEKYKNVTVIMDEVTYIDKASRLVYMGERIIRYDYLIVAAGVQTGYFGHDDWKKFTSGLKNLAEALQIRNRLLMSFEHAENDPENAGEIMKYVIVGGGPTGVEIAGSFAELSHNIIRNDFRNIDTAKSKIILIEGGSDLLPSFDRDLSVYAKKTLQKRGVDVMLNTRVEKIERKKVYIRTSEGEKVIDANLIIWAAGVEPVALTKTLSENFDRQKRIIVTDTCSLKDYPDVFIVGDMAAFKTEDGAFLPGVSAVAMQEGRYVAKTIIDELRGRKRKPFHYFDKGSMATIGRNDAVGKLGKVKLTGFAAWLMWLIIHLFYQVGFKNKESILFTWIWSYITYGAGARVIVDPFFIRK